MFVTLALACLVTHFSTYSHSVLAVHMHGHKFQVVRVALDVASSDPALNPPHSEGAANPSRRDTITIPAGGAYNIRFRADNPGAWLFHCHIEWVRSSLSP